jgi:hypothetical protein
MVHKLVKLVGQNRDWDDYDVLFLQNHVKDAVDLFHVHGIALLFELVDVTQQLFVLEVVLLE